MRGKSVKLQQPYIQEKEGIVGIFLFENRDIQETKREITSFWKINEKIREEKERNRHVSKLKKEKIDPDPHTDSKARQGVPIPRPNSRKN